ncbi:MAG: hypothetical protein WAK67_03465 [Xanthobacteraceae bacterium]
MRYIVYGLAIFAAVLAVTFTTGYLPRDATASHNESNDKMNVLELQNTSDAKALPGQEIPDEVYRQFAFNNLVKTLGERSSSLAPRLESATA